MISPNLALLWLRSERGPNFSRFILAITNWLLDQRQRALARAPISAALGASLSLGRWSGVHEHDRTIIELIRAPKSSTRVNKPHSTRRLRTKAVNQVAPIDPFQQVAWLRQHD